MHVLAVDEGLKLYTFGAQADGHTTSPRLIHLHGWRRYDIIEDEVLYQSSGRLAYLEIKFILQCPCQQGEGCGRSLGLSSISIDAESLIRQEKVFVKTRCAFLSITAPFGQDLFCVN